MFCVYTEVMAQDDTVTFSKDHNAVTPVRLEPAALRSRVKHSTTEPLRSLKQRSYCNILLSDIVHVMIYTAQ